MKRKIEVFAGQSYLQGIPISEIDVKKLLKKGFEFEFAD